eukprot:jgi/Psemu1/35288/gm1.35288_g
MKRSYDPADHRAEAHQKLQLTRELKWVKRIKCMVQKTTDEKASEWRAGQCLQSVSITMELTNQSLPDDRQQRQRSACWPGFAMYLYNDGNRLYSNQLVSQRLKELQITNKKPSIEAFKAYSPANMTKKILNQLNSWAICFRRLQTVGIYKKGQRLTMMIAVEPGDPELPDKITENITWPWQWVDVRRVTGTTGDSFASFIGSICTLIKDHQRVTETNIDYWKVFLWDNLSSHYSTIVYESVMGRVRPTQFDILPRLAYQPKYRLIEYVICQLLNYMKVKVMGELDLDQMEQQILNSAAAIGPFDATFAHCGYSEDGLYPGVEILPINPNSNPPGWGPLGPPGAELPPVALV